MEPTLSEGDRLAVRGGSRAVARAGPGDLVVVRLPGGRPVSIKRLVHRDGTGLWVQRDNPAEGVDSWQIGAIPERDLLGVVAARLWPRPSRLRGGPRDASGRYPG